MSNYAISYFGEPSFDSQEASDEARARFQMWIDGLGDALVNPGTPLGMPKIVTGDGISEGDKATRLTGFSIVKADSIDAVVEMVKECPYLEHGRIEVAEVFEM